MQGRHFASAAVMVAGLLLLGGCTSTQTGQVWSPLKYASYQEAMKGSPALRRSETQKCYAHVRAKPALRGELGNVLNLPPNRDPTPLYCQRLIAALTSGRLNYADYRNSTRGEVTPKLIRVIQGR